MHAQIVVWGHLWLHRSNSYHRRFPRSRPQPYDNPWYGRIPPLAARRAVGPCTISSRLVVAKMKLRMPPSNVPNGAFADKSYRTEEYLMAWLSTDPPTCHTHARVLTLQSFCPSRLILPACCGADVVAADKREAADEAHKRFATKGSDHCQLLNIYNAWASISSFQARRDFCRLHFLSDSALLQVATLRQQLIPCLCEIGFLGGGGRDKFGSTASSNDRAANEHSHSLLMVKAVVCAGLYPSLVHLKLPKVLYHETAAGVVETVHRGEHPHSIALLKLYSHCCRYTCSSCVRTTLLSD